MPESEICRMDAITLRDNIRSGTLSPTDVVEAILGRIDELDPVLHAFCTPTPELARTEAKRIERDLARGHDVGALAGVEKCGILHNHDGCLDSLNRWASLL